MADESPFRIVVVGDIGGKQPNQRCLSHHLFCLLELFVVARLGCTWSQI